MGLALGLGLGLGLGRVACGVLRVVCDVWCVAPEDLLVLEFGPARAHLRCGRQRRRLRGGRA